MEIFLSYAHDDQHQANEVIKALEAAEITYFCAHKSLDGGALFKEDIRLQLRECTEVFVLVTANSIKSQWVTVEWGAAWALGTHVTPILYRCAPKDLPDQLQDLHVRDFHELDKVISEFQERKKNRLARSLITLSRQQGASAAARYFIGLDIGKGQIDYSVLDCECLSRPQCRQDSDDPPYSLYRGSCGTPNTFEEIYPVLRGIVEEISEKCQADRVYPLSGIGVGLPGMVNPRTGMLVFSPSFDARSENFVDILNKHLDWSGHLGSVIPQGSSDIPIRIDNDVRCATRWHWITQAPNVRNMVCIFVGNGLGSGIIANGNMLYGSAFLAGEAGHTTIAKESSLFRNGLTKCHCGKSGLHWEMHTCRYGILHIWKTHDPNKAKEVAKKHSVSIEDVDIPLLAQAFYEGEEYTGSIVDLFLEYLAIGLSNYIYVLNPERVVLGGGMIRAFYSKKNKSPYYGDTTHKILHQKIDKYVFPQFEGDYLVIEGTPKQDVASLGAALIYKDSSFPVGEG